ncbi:ComF family protein [Aureibacter tunicatorum]|uniref:ComF family protein n=1 Tax=Aureibacter tunicatorum TaxID=866807 RepID=A0AAE4BP07_9BACT|nr:hypothetical protein [Aureibacter tunicatorum]MDR6237414.1 ComF family protein [Aureibacter tunicatorum]BDD06404.1 amidophosphoribosyltransferase [Aureibacter tunicatorum]
MLRKNTGLRFNILRYTQDLFDLFFPLTCAACEKDVLREEDRICSSCRMSFIKSEANTLEETKLKNRFIEFPNIDHIYSLYKFARGNEIQNLIHAIKYENHPKIAVKLGNWLGAHIAEQNTLSAYNAIAPVPLHPKKLKIRGYNQSSLISAGISETLGIPVIDDLLVRTKHTETQTKKSRWERYKNTSEKFNVNNPNDLPDKILIVDDILTSGATLTSCASAIHKHKKSNISMAVIAYAIN